MRKVVACILCICMLIGIGSVCASAKWPDILINNDFDEDGNLITSILDSSSDSEMDFLNRTFRSTVKALENMGKLDEAGKVAESADTWAKMFSTAMNVIIPGGQIFTFINGTMIFLKTIGVVEDPTMTKLASIESTVKSIQQTVQEIDSKIDDLDNGVTEVLTELKYKDRIDNYWNYHTQWTTFYNECISRLNALKTSYSNNLISLILQYGEDWQNGGIMGLRALYDENGNQIYSAHNLNGVGSVLPQCPGKANDSTSVSYSVTVPDEYIHIDRDINLNAENYLTVFRAAVKEAVINAADDGNLIAYNGFYDKWNSMTVSEKSICAEKLAENLIDALMFEVCYVTANNTDFITNLENAFSDYCTYLCQKDNLVSPFDAQLQMLAYTHCFEGEVKQDASFMYSYFNNLTLNYGAFFTMIMSLAQIKTTAERTAYKNLWWETLNRIFKDFDSFITGNNNYCYILGCPLEYRNIEFTSQVSFTCHYPISDSNDPESQYYSFTYEENARTSKSWALIDKSKTYNTNDPSQVSQHQAELSNSMLSSDELSLIYRVYQCEKSGRQADTASFMEYLVNNNVALPKSASETQDTYGLNTTVVAKGFSSANMGLNSGAALKNVRKCYDNCEYYFTEGETVVLSGDLPGDDDCYVIHDRVVGDTFDMRNGTLKSNTNIESKVFYGQNKWNWFYDEIWALSSGRIDVSYTARITTSDDGENYFGERTYYVDYSDDFSAIVKTQTGTYTVPADVRSIGDGLFSDGTVLDSITFNGKPQISENAFEGVGTETRRCYVNVPESWGELSMGETWYGGYFGNAHITADANISDGLRKIVTVYEGMPCTDVPYQFGDSVVPEHKYFDGWADSVNGTALKSQNDTVTDGMTLYAVWKYDCGLEAKGSTVIDYENGYIYGIKPGADSLNDYISPSDGYTLSVSASSDKCGTNTVVEVYSGEEITGRFIVVVFGDVNGDGWYDGMDSVIVNCLANGMLTREQVGEAVYMAADCSHDDVIDENDTAILEQAGVILASVNQSKSSEKLAEDSAYAEYLSLIDQNPTQQVQAEEPVDEGFNQSILQRIIDFIVYIFNLIKSFIAKF